MDNKPLTELNERKITKKTTKEKTKTKEAKDTKKITKPKQPQEMDEDDGMKYDILRVQVYNSKGEREKESDFKLKFKALGKRSKDETKRFNIYKNTAYEELLNEYLFPIITRGTFITSDEYEPYKGIPKYTIIAIRQNGRKNNEQIFTYEDYEYRYVKRTNMIYARYIGNKEIKQIKSFPFPSFNGMNISYENCYEDCEMETFDMNNLIIDNCVCMNYMFKNCVNLKQLFNFTFKNTKLSSLIGMFMCCISLTNIDCSKCDLKLDTLDLDDLFYGCINLSSLDISGIRFFNKYYGDMEKHGIFKYCYKLADIIATKETFNVIKELIPMQDAWVSYKLALKSQGRKLKIKQDDNKIVHYINSFNNNNFENFIINEAGGKDYIILPKGILKHSISVNQLSTLSKVDI